jgi:formate hydrogenlyase subunit 4
LQPYFDLIRLVQKGTVFSYTTTWVFRAGPVVGFASVIAASLLAPMGSPLAPIFFTGDLVLLLYLFALGRFFTVSAALDTGSAFEGMGASREVSYAAVAEPALLLGLLVLVRLSGKYELSAMLSERHATGVGLADASLLLVILSWFIVLLAENCRVPFDDPNTHLELTMIHEVIVLDHSGPAFGLILYGASIKLMVFGALLLRLIMPWRHDGGVWDWLSFILAELVLAVIIGIVESVMARLRLLDIPKLLVAAGVLSAFGLVLVNRT